ncbi:MAG: glycosyltransferase family 2 protein [Bacteroidota bacterium]
MAGLGSRFAEAGYDKPKPLIDVDGEPMIKRVVDSLGIDGNYIFIVQKEHSVKYHLQDVLDEIAPGCKIVEIDGLTDGAARTTLAAKNLIDNDTPLLIANSDQVIVWDSSAISSIVASWDVVALFLAHESKWSYSKIEDSFITEIAEKKVISEFANVGIYGWSKGSDYVKYAEQMIAKGIKTNNEFYIAPVYNEAIADGKKVYPFFVDKMYGVGTPEDLEKYLNDKER